MKPLMSASEIEQQSVISSPTCGYSKEEAIPTISCQSLAECNESMAVHELHRDSDSTGCEQRTMGHQEDLPLLERLNIGDEDAFRFVFEQYQSALVRLASNYVPNMNIAEEVVQETWLAVFRGVRRFERRSSLKTWIISIMLKRAKSCAAREGRYLPLADEFDQEHERFEPIVASDECRSDTVIGYAHHWIPATLGLSLESDKAGIVEG